MACTPSGPWKGARHDRRQNPSSALARVKNQAVKGRGLGSGGLLVGSLVVAYLVVAHVGSRLDDVYDVWRLVAIAAAGALVAALGVSLIYHAFLGAAFWSTCRFFGSSIVQEKASQGSGLGLSVAARRVSFG